MRFLFACSGALLLVALAGPARAARSISIEAGPTTMTAEERAIEADPAAGVEHAVILVEETFRDEDEGGSSETTYHLRAKILSNEGRDLADVEIPVPGSGNALREWWGRVILPDGQSLVLPQSRVENQAVVSRSGNTKLTVVKAALPGVVPGCVIDYGYRVHYPAIHLYDRVPIQREHPVREFLYRWKPFALIQGAYSLHRAEGMDLRATVERNEVVVRARNVPPFTREPVMPPDHEVQASLVTYYIEPDSSFDGFWSDLGRQLDYLAAVGKKRSAKEALETMGISAAEGGLERQLRAVYDWIGENVANEGLLTFEEMQQAVSEKDSSSRDVIADVMRTRRGTPLELQQLFIAVARELGAEAHFALVPDRTQNLLDPDLKSPYQFDMILVAVRPGGGGNAVWIVYPGSGLPFGEVPWRYAGTQGMELGKKVERVIDIPVGSPAANVALSQVELVFNEDNDGMVSRWTSSGTGQVGDDERRYLRSLPPADRSRWVDALCGDGPSVDVIEAEVVDLDELGRDFELNCEVEDFDIQVGEHIGVYELGWSGPWIRALPELRDEQRHYAVVFDYPRVDALELTTAGPQGFVLEDPPPPTKIENRFGSYELRIQRVDDGVKVSRALAIFALVVKRDEYGELREFFDEVARLDRTALRFRRERSQP